MYLDIANILALQFPAKTC